MDNNLSTIMGARLLKVKDVADGTGLARNTVSLIRNKKAVNVTVPTLIKLCDYLGVPLHELIDYTPKMVKA